jgi:predicted ATPase
MKIKMIHFNNLGPVSDAVSPIDFRDTWGKKIYSPVLLSGPNGCGKTILLNSIAFLWEALAHWLNYKTIVPGDSQAGKWFDKWGGFAVVIDEVPNFSSEINRTKNSSSKNNISKICLLFGDDRWIEKIKNEHKDVHYWLGEIKRGKQDRVLLDSAGDKFFDYWGKAYKKLVLGKDQTGAPNLVYLDSEERQWVNPTANIGELTPDDMTKRWLFRYRATKDWKDQLENSLVNFKITTSQKEFKKVVNTLNAFLPGKVIVTDIRPEDRNRFRVRLNKGKSRYHYFDELSSGERQVLIVLFNVLRWLEQGGIVMIDEPDLFLHPSLVTRLLAALEGIVYRRNGQLIITSHNIDVWDRFENLGKRVKLGEFLS